ncbi:MAG: ABC transporter ATP-binding protein [Oligoflexia bacterium]|nr:ABC transporter ATP-binding protein [Oligoflexia bacterium]
MRLATLRNEPDSAQPSAAQPFAFKLSNVTVAYRSYQERPSSLKETVIRFMRTGKMKHYSTFDALNDVSLEINKGTVLGIIGSNGSGKSTLLKVMAQVLKPTQGRVVVNGSVSSLIELGVGFDPELNAVENIFLNGSLHKKSNADIKSRVDHILEFAELHDFARTPIKYFSSGMAARLGFAVAIDINPDILIVDEILAVGDERFQAKCSTVFQNFLKSGKTIIIVSHDMSMLEHTAREIVLLSRGKIVFRGDPHHAIGMYRDKSYETALQG